MKMNILKKLSSLVIAAAVFATACDASALTIGDSRELGFVNYGIPAGDADITSYVNALIALPTGGSTVVNGNSIMRSLNVFSPLDPAVLAVRANYGDVAGNTVSIDLGLGGYLYLLAKYDGPNYGSEVWYVGGLTGIITIPSAAGGPNNDKYGISGTSLFTPTTTTVPDGGMTVMLLGSALAGLGVVRRFIRR